MVSDMPNILFIVEHVSNSWGIAANGCLKALGCTGSVIGQVEFLNKTPDLKAYTTIFNYMWRDEKIMKLLQAAKGRVVNCIASGPDMDSASLETFKANTQGFRLVGANTAKGVTILNALDADTMVFNLSHGVDTDMFKPQPIAHQGFKVGWIGRTKYPLKRFEFAQKVIAGVQGAEMVVAGNKTDPAGQPWYEHSDMPKFYNGLDVLLITSRSESHPLIALEAMASGVVVVSTNVGDLESVILNGVNGFLLPIEADENRFRLILNYLKDNPERRKGIGGLARAAVVQNWTWGRVIEPYKNIIGA